MTKRELRRILIVSVVFIGITIAIKIFEQMGILGI